MTDHTNIPAQPRTWAQTRAEILAPCIYFIPSLIVLIPLYDNLTIIGLMIVCGLCIAATFAFAWFGFLEITKRWPGSATYLSTPLNPLHYQGRNKIDADFLAGLVLARGIQSEGVFHLEAIPDYKRRLPLLEACINAEINDLRWGEGYRHRLEPLELLAVMQQLTGGLNPYALGPTATVTGVNLDHFSSHEKLQAIEHYEATMSRLKAKVVSPNLALLRKRSVFPIS